MPRLLSRAKGTNLGKSVQAILIHCILIVICFLFVTGKACVALHFEISNESSAQNLSAHQQLNNVKYGAQIQDKNNTEPQKYIPFFSPFLKSKYYERVYQFWSMNKSSNANTTVREYIHDIVLARAFTSPMGDESHHYYLYPGDLRPSGGPHVDQELCLKQLSQLNERAQVFEKEKVNSKDIEFGRLLDTFGRMQSGLAKGHSFWLGSYDDCLALKVTFKEGKSAMRYCSAAIKLNGWPEDEDLDKVAVLKMGVCLPKACDSQQYKNKLELVQQLAELNGRQLDIGTWNFTYLYCLPDEESDLRIWWKSPGAVVTVALCSGWLTLLAFATIKHCAARAPEAGEQGIECNPDNNNNDNSNGKKGLNDQLQFAGQEPRKKSNWYEVCKALSVIENFNGLINIKKQAKRSSSIVVDLSVLDGIKVLLMIWIVLGHTFLFNTSTMGNWAEYWKYSLSFPIFSQSSAFAVNGFFAITGLLTTYWVFKRQSPAQIQSFASPIKWFAFAINRYFRLIPIYMVALLYAKCVAVYSGSGPLWDYATSATSFRRDCKDESWLLSITLTSNFRIEPYDCVPPSWYLCNDWQFSIVTPLFLASLATNETLGKLLILISFLASFSATAFAQYNTPSPDMRPLALFRPHYVKSVVPFMGPVFTRPYYRIGPYLAGLLLGLTLYKYERKKLEWLARKVERERVMNDAQTTNQAGNQPANINDLEPEWSESFRRLHPNFIFPICLFSTLVTPFFLPYVEVNKAVGRVLAAAYLAFFNNFYAIITGLYILLATTGHGWKQFDRFLAHPIWKPFSKISLSVLVINWEVTQFIFARATHARHADFLFTLLINIYCVVATYLIAIVLFVLFESPLNKLVNRLLASIFSTK